MKYINDVYEFSFVPPTVGTYRVNAPPMIATFYGERSRDGFANNVNVTVQEGRFSRESYFQQTLAIIARTGLQLRSHSLVEITGREGIILDFEANLQGRALRYLSLAVIDAERIIVVTATIAANEFGKLKGEYEAYLRSLSFGQIRESGCSAEKPKGSGDKES